jgi:uncharacterized protein YgiM (DUF1202 family)
VLLSVLAILNSCALIKPKQPQRVYYTIPSVTYIRESPGYASRNVATVYRGEQVTVLSKIADDWCQVQTVQGQQVGWIQRPLLSPVPIPTEIYTVQENEVPLRDVPQREGTSRQVLRRGDKIRKLSENQQGWWWVLVEKDESLGWLSPAAAPKGPPETAPPGQAAGPTGKESPELSASSPPAPPPYLYVATANLELHLLPLVSSQVVKVLKFNDKVEKLAQSGSEWLKVKYPGTGAQGWAQTLALSGSPSSAPKILPPVKKKPVKKPGAGRPTEPETTEPEAVEPEVM